MINIEAFKPQVIDEPISLIFDFYSISLKRDLNARIKYGQQDCDFDEGVMFFMSPGQVWGLEFEKDSTQIPSGWMILIHPDFLWNTPYPKDIRLN